MIRRRRKLLSPPAWRRKAMLRVYRNILEHETETAKDEPDRARLIFLREQAIALVMLCMAEGPDLDALGIALVIQSVKSSTSVH